MKKDKRWLVPSLCTAMLVLFASCAAIYIPKDSTVNNMSVREARNLLATEMKRCDVYSNGEKLWYKITDVRVTWERLIVTDDRGKDSIFIFSDLPEISMNESLYTKLAGQDAFRRRDNNVDSAFLSVSALYVLKQNAIKIKVAEEQDSRFAASLADYHKNIASNAALPEEANRYKVQAEGAVRDKQFDDAADFYAAALKIVPWWPVGHFNRALVLGETGEYGEAMREMKYYLQLVPNAPNARAAQDKIYDWERLESK